MKLLSTFHIQNGRLISPSGESSGNEDPLQVATALAERGCSKLCLLDVNAAHGTGHNRDEIVRIMQRFHQLHPKGCIQVGGGIRSSDQAQFYLDHGATWLLVGTLLHRSPILVEQMVARFHEHLTAALDVKKGLTQASGWLENMPITPAEAARRIREFGFRRVLFSDVPEKQDAEPDFQTAACISEHSHLPLLMGGNIRTLDHLTQAGRVPGLCGVLVEARIMLAQADSFEAHHSCV